MVESAHPGVLLCVNQFFEDNLLLSITDISHCFDLDHLIPELKSHGDALSRC